MSLFYTRVSLIKMRKVWPAEVEVRKKKWIMEPRISNHKGIYFICIHFSFHSPSSSNTKSLEVSASFSWSFNKQYVMQALRTTSEFVCFFWQGSDKWFCTFFLRWFIPLLRFCLESGAVWLIWEPLPVHPFTSVGKQKCQEHMNIKSYYSITTWYTFLFLCLS